MKVTSQLINQFKRYLEQKSQETGETFDFDISSSIYEYSEEFEEFIEEKYGNVDNSVFSKGFDTKELQNISFKDGEFIADKSNKSDDAAFFAQMLNDLMENDEFKTSFDSDGDVKISEEEYCILLRG